MKKSVVKRIESEIAEALVHYPNMDKAYALKLAKRDYLDTPKQRRAQFTIFNKGVA